MVELELSMMAHNPQVEALLRPLLDAFEQKTGNRVHIQMLTWDVGRAELNRNALYHHGPDVSEIGSTWVSDLVAMNALRSFTPQEIARIGRPEEFAPSGWDTCHLHGDKTIWAVPLTVESFFIHYRRDLLAKAGVDEAGAFSSHEQMEQTAQALMESGVHVPVIPPIFHDRYGALHSLASWIWAQGGDFCSPDGKKVIFDQPEALRGIQSYFRFLRHVTPQGQKLLKGAAADLFNQGHAAMAFGTRTFYSHNAASALPAVKANWGAAVFPGARFAGGANLVVWKHTRHEEAALELVRYLTSPQVIMDYILDFYMLPPRLSLLDSLAVQSDPISRVMAESVRTGRAHTAIPLWGLIEERFIGLLAQINEKLFSDLSVEVDPTVQKAVEMTARRLNLTLSK